MGYKMCEGPQQNKGKKWHGEGWAVRDGRKTSDGLGGQGPLSPTFRRNGLLRGSSWTLPMTKTCGRTGRTNAAGKTEGITSACRLWGRPFATEVRKNNPGRGCQPMTQAVVVCAHRRFFARRPRRKGRERVAGRTQRWGQNFGPKAEAGRGLTAFGRSGRRLGG